MNPRIAIVGDRPDLVRRVAAAGNYSDGPAPYVDTYSDLAEAIEEAEGADVLVAGPECRGLRGLGALAAFHEMSPRTGIVLAFDDAGADVRDVVWTGAEAMVDPSSDEEVGIAVRRSLSLAAKRRAAQGLAARPIPAGGSGDPTGPQPPAADRMKRIEGLFRDDERPGPKQIVAPTR